MTETRTGSAQAVQRGSEGRHKEKMPAREKLALAFPEDLPSLKATYFFFFFAFFLATFFFAAILFTPSLAAFIRPRSSLDAFLCHSCHTHLFKSTEKMLKTKKISSDVSSRHPNCSPRSIS